MNITEWLKNNLIVSEGTHIKDESIPVVESQDEFVEGWNSCIRHLLKDQEEIE